MINHTPVRYTATGSSHTILKIDAEEKGELPIRSIDEAGSRPPEQRMPPSAAEPVKRGEKLADEGSI